MVSKGLHYKGKQESSVFSAVVFTFTEWRESSIWTTINAGNMMISAKRSSKINHNQHLRHVDAAFQTVEICLEGWARNPAKTGLS